MRLGTIVTALIVSAALVASPAGAAKFTVNTASGQGEPDPDPNSVVQEAFNPTINCSGTEGGTIWDVLLCLLDELVTLPGAPCIEIEIVGQDNGTGPDGEQAVQEVMQDSDHGDCPVNPDDREDFIVRMLPEMPPYGLEILTTDYEEIEKITLMENDSSIQWTELTLLKSHRRIRIGEIVENPSGRGAIHIRLNHHEMKISTAGYKTSVELTAGIIRTLRNNGYEVDYEAPYIWLGHGQRRNHIGRVSFRSTDPAVVSSDIGMLPPDPSVTESEIHPIELLELDSSFDPIRRRLDSSRERH